MDAIKNLFGGGAQDKLVKQQQKQLAEQERSLDAVEAGQRKLRTGGRGLLAFIDEQLGGALGGTS